MRTKTVGKSNGLKIKLITGAEIKPARPPYIGLFIPVRHEMIANIMTLKIMVYQCISYNKQLYRNCIIRF